MNIKELIKLLKKNAFINGEYEKVYIVTDEFEVYSINGADHMTLGNNDELYLFLRADKMKK